MLDIALLGCGGSMPIPNRFLTSLLIKYKGRKILIDCGEGTQVSMKILKWGFKSIDIICITHRHGDHILGLPGLLSTIGNSGRTKPITIIGPRGIEAIIKGLKLAVPNIPFQVEIIEDPKGLLGVKVSSEGMKVKKTIHEESYNDDFVISTLELDHSVPCIGYSFYIPRRPKFNIDKAISNEVPKELWKKLQSGEVVIYEGKSFEPKMVLGKERKGIKLSYIMDTRPIDTISGFIRNSDLFICEGTYGDDEDLEKAIKNKHMIFREAAQLAYEGDVDELLITHFSPAMDEPELYIENAKKIFYNTNIGHDRLIKSISFKDE
ncbi:MAG: ribonuclease Z [Tissierellia bacterium]|nr:ribonuclease Z [Tissierellia bacterium]